MMLGHHVVYVACQFLFLAFQHLLFLFVGRLIAGDQIEQCHNAQLLPTIFDCYEIQEAVVDLLIRNDPVLGRS